MRLSFDSIEEVKAFVASLKGTRGKKGDDETSEAALTTGNTMANVPNPIMPPTAGAISGQPMGFNPAGFAPPAPGAATGGGFPAAAAGPSPEVMALVSAINAKLDASIGSGQPAEGALTWFRGEIGKTGRDASAATLDQIKTVFLPQTPLPALQNIAKLMAIV